MNPLNTDGIAERLDRMERENRLLRWIGATLFLGLVVIVGAGTAFSNRDLVKARGFEVRDKDGRVRARLGIDAATGPGLVLLDPSGRTQLSVSAAPNATSIELHDRGQVRIALNSATDGSATLHFFDQERNVPTSFYMWPDSSTGLFLSSRENPIHLSARPDGEARLSVLDEAFNEKTALALNKDGSIQQLPIDVTRQFRPGEPPVSAVAPIDGRAFSALLSDEVGGGL